MGRPFRNSEGNAIDGGSKLRAGPQDLREIPGQRAGRPRARSRSAAPRFAPAPRTSAAKAIAYAEKNVQASLDYAQSLLKAKDLTEVMRLHSEYVQAPDALAGGAGQRNGPDRRPRRDGCGQAENLTSACSRTRAGPQATATLGCRTANVHPVRVTYAALHQNCVALHKIDMIWVFIGRARGWALP